MIDEKVKYIGTSIIILIIMLFFNGCYIIYTYCQQILSMYM